MPKVGYSPQERARIRTDLIAAGLALMAEQGIRHTTVEQIYQKVGISRTFFYSFFPSKEDFVLEALYDQQPRVLAFARDLMAQCSCWQEAVRRFLSACCYGEKNGIVVMTIEEQQALFCRLSPQNKKVFRERQHKLFAGILECFGVAASRERVALFTNLSLAAMIVRRAVPQSLPFFVPEAADDTVACQIDAVVRCLESFRTAEQG